MSELLHKYPRTRHILDSRLQHGDEDLEAAGFGDIEGRHLVIEEKLDGANAGFSFTAAGAIRLQSRGHYLDGGARERQFDRFKAWAVEIAQPLFERIGPRRIVYGEWLYAKHTIFYDALPDHFMEFDVLDLDAGRFLSTPERRALFAGTGLSQVPVLHEGRIASPAALKALCGRSLYKSDDWRERLQEAASRPPHHPGKLLAQTDASDLAEGLYIKDETEGHVSARYKYVRASFLQAVEDSGGHWRDRPIPPNQLAREQRR